MSWKKAVFFGGAVLVLAACDNAIAPTSPSALTRLNGAAVSATKKTTSTTPPADTVPPSGIKNVIGECASAVIHVGENGELTVICASGTSW